MNDGALVPALSRRRMTQQACPATPGGSPLPVAGRRQTDCAPLASAWLLAGALLVSTVASAAQAVPSRHGAATLPVASTSIATHSSADAAATRIESNEALIRAAFDAWRAGTGNVFDLLADDAQWTVAGDSPVSGVYTSKQDFLNRAVAPIVARLATPIVPEVLHVVAQDDAVMVLWRGSALARDGSTYTNHYAWHMELEAGRIARVVAFLDTWALAELME